MEKILRTIDKIWNKAKEIISSPETKERARKEERYFTRTRGMSFSDNVVFLLEKANESLQTALNRFLENRNPISEQAFSKARNHYDESPFVKLFDMTVTESYAEGSGITKKWNGYYLFGIDGSTVALPNGNPGSLKKAFGEMNGAPTARASCAFDVLSERVAAVEFDSVHIGERELAKRHIEKIHKAGITDALFIFDRGYPSIELFDLLEYKGYKYVMRVKKGYNAEIDSFKGEFRCLKIGGKYRNVVKFKLDSDEEETLITNLSIEGISVSFFKELYFKRWGIETNFGTLKQKLQIEAFSGLTETAVKQDFWAAMFLNNMALIEKYAADKEIESGKSADNKWKYKANINELIGSLKGRLVRILLSSDEEYIKNPFDDSERSASRDYPDSSE